MSSKYTLTIRVTDDDIDPQGHVNNVAFVRYVQEAAVAHWRAVASPESRAAFTWVVRRHEVEYLRPGMPGDELIVRTWVGEPSGATWERFTEVGRVGEDRAIVTARTVWVLLDAVSMRPWRVDAGLVAQFAGQDSPPAAVWRGKVSLNFALLLFAAAWSVRHIRIRGGTAPALIA